MDNLLLYILKASAWLAFFYGFYWLFLRKETFFVLNRIYLVFTAFMTLILPLIPISSPFGRKEIIIRPEFLGFAAGPEPKSPGLADILIFFYITVSVLLLGRFLFRLGQLAALTKGSDIQRVNGTKVVYLDRNCSTFSFFNWIFLQKSHAVDKDFNRILTHELVHIKQYHSLDIILIELLSIVLWFNPFVWPYKKSLREIHEYLADQAVIAQGCSLVGYQLLILEQHVGGKLFEFASNFRNSQIKRRLTMLSKTESKKMSRLKFFLVLPLAVLLFLAFADSSPVIVVEDTPSGETGEMYVPLGKAELTPPQENEDVIKKYEMKLKELEKIKADNKKKIEEILAKYKAANDNGENGDEAKLEAVIKKAKLKDMELSAKQGEIKLALLKNKISSETDTETKSKLKKKFEAIQAENDKLNKKLEQIKVSEETQKKEEKKKEKK